MPETEELFGEYIDFEVKRKFGIITLNRVHRSNAFTQEQLTHLCGALEYCQLSEKIRGIILTNNGESFSTGMDLDYIDGSNHAAVKQLESTAADIVNLIWDGKPIICALNGRCMGEGVVFAIACDYRIATKGSFFWMPEILSGIFPGTGCTILFSKILGISWTKKMLMLAEEISAEKALEIDLIDHVVENKDELIEEAMNRAKFLFTKNQTVLNAIKLCSNHLMDKSYTRASLLESFASSWFEHQNETIFLSKLRRMVQE